MMAVIEDEDLGRHVRSRRGVLYKSALRDRQSGISRVTRRTSRAVSLARIIFKRFYEDRCMQIASSLTFTSLLAIVPMITVALTVITAFPVFGTMTAALQTFVVDNMMPASADVISMHTQEFTRNAARLTAVGIVFLFVTSIMLLLTIDRAFNDIFRVKRPRSIVQRIFVYWTLIT